MKDGASCAATILELIVVGGVMPAEAISKAATTISSANYAKRLGLDSYKSLLIRLGKPGEKSCTFGITNPER